MRSSRSCLASRSSLWSSSERFFGRFSITLGSDLSAAPGAGAVWRVDRASCRADPTTTDLADKLRVTCIRYLASAALGAMAGAVKAEREAREDAMVAAGEVHDALGGRSPEAKPSRVDDRVVTAAGIMSRDG